ncbi:flagellar basal-body rod protein FlgG [Rickettsiales endosymbiont of Stachyamoeba lipophora]|uniref:flagellar basal-body rod protein FlgG n=1 Tax=Rickettsiales endosymbiont of Stachyamoeba lipophora TaxID=2486578 RepID=UPI000F648E14|nr:flagellar basal-body rod protein FlgG [Rickettsiales endosymbiont of Stachyamoeba lipophora]AZL15664.1 flagellar basal-body rod protein FlgG [Rickettsiales endosymbiont of Stachyamoeba lipophora]
MANMDIAASGMQGFSKMIEVLSNNIANSQTIGYKEQRVEFQDLLYINQKRVGMISSDAGNSIPTGIQVGLGVNMGAIYRIHTQGDLQETGNDTDMAIRGKGYFRIELPNGEFGYTRAGAFSINENGEIVTSNGHIVSPGIIAPDDALEININDTGQVFVTLRNDPNPQLLGQFQLYRFINDKGLQAYGENLFLETQASGQPIVGFPGEANFGTIKQKWLEFSNVNVVTQITSLIRAQRGYEFCSNFIQAISEMLKTANQIKA